MTDIERFLSKAQDLATPTPHPDVSLTDDDWNQLAPGVDPSAYDPKPLPSPVVPIAPPPLPLIDTGKIPSTFEPPSKTDVEDFFATPGVCGLLNLGNTCYMNAGLQCVFSVEQIAKFYLSDCVPRPMVGVVKKKISEENQSERMETVEGKRGSVELLEGKVGVERAGEGKEKEREVKRARKEKEGPEEGEEFVEKEEGSSASNVDSEKKAQSMGKKSNVSLLCQGHVSSSFSFLMRKLWTGQFSSIVPKNFKTILGFLFSQFNGFRQQDCQEFLAVLLDRLHEEIHHSINETGLCNNGPSIGSVIANTFQGELKSKVTCCRCGHVSTKLDPFMYLSVPIPHAHERQIEIVWAPISRTPARRKLVRCLVVVPKLSTVLHIKQALCELLEGVVSPDHITLAHVKNCTIELTLGDSLASSHVKDSEFQVYGFETDTRSSSNVSLSEKSTKESPSDKGYVKLQDGGTEQSAGAHLDPWTVQTNANETTSSQLPDENMETETTPLIGVDDDDDDDNETTPLVNGVSTVAGKERQVVVMEWYSCGICLEEMVDSDLLTHTSCGALLCADCLESSKQHSLKDDGQMPCPVCQTLLVPSKGFTPLAKRDNTSNVVRLLQIMVLFRQEDTSENWSLFGHPALINLPCSDSVDHYYTAVSTIIPTSLSGQPWSLALTDGKGRFCSRCLYTANCRGCVLTNAMKDVSLKPGDHLSVTFRHLLEDSTSEAGWTESHPSLSSRWPSSVSLHDCLALFSQKEVLGSDNPWWCPQCDSNQQAMRCLTISRLPSTLIVHLKRFLFQESSASKVDKSVSFPLTLSPSSLITDITYEALSGDLLLTACVCHFGTLNSGHYTAYSRHLVTGRWHYYNDESVTEAIPSNKDSGSAYILFYAQQREGTKCNASEQQLPTERGVVSCDNEDELLQMEPLLRLMKPKPAPPLPLLPPLKRASSLGSLVDSGDQQFQLMLAESLGLPGATPLAPAVPPKRSSSNPRISTGDTQGTVLSHFKSFEA